MRTITKIDLCPEEKQKIQLYPSNQQVGRSVGYLDCPADLPQIVDSVMREDTLLGSEYRDVLEIMGLSYDNQLSLGADPHLPSGYIENKLRTIK